MKKLLRSVAVVVALSSISTASAQLPPNGIYPGGLEFDSYVPSPNYTGNHIYALGHWRIDSILDANSSVVLDMFATWCGPCWNYHQAGILENLYDTRGWGAPNPKTAIFAVESDNSTPGTQLESSTLGDWINNTKYPMANDGAAASMFNLSYYPTLVIVCPDRQVTEVGQQQLAGWEAAVDGCSPAAQFANDVRIVADNTPDDVPVCGATTASVDIEVVVQNYSTAAINGNYDIVVKDASGTVIAGPTTAALNLAAYATQTVVVGTVTANTGANAFTVEITTSDDDVSNNTYTVNVNVSAAQTLDVWPNKEVTIDMNIDNYASEVGFALREGVPATADPAALFSTSNAGNSDAYMATGTLTDGTNTFNQTYTVANHGCHYFVVVDTYGDGITYQNPNGKIDLISSSTVTIPGDYGSGTVVALDFVEVASIDENENTISLSVYPNPAKDIANISFDLTDNANVNIEMVNALGQKVYTEALTNVTGQQTVAINTSDIKEGVYFVNITVNGSLISTKKVTVIK